MKRKLSDEPRLAPVREPSEAPAQLSRAFQEQSVERQLSSARARALARSSRFLATALELVQESHRADFTVQTLVDRSNLSLRAFYQHFAGKEELLLALYESMTIQFTDDIRQEVDAADGALDKLEAFCRGYLSRAEASGALGGRVVTIYHLSLEIERPADFAKVWEPQQKLLKEILTACRRAGLLRKDLTLAQLTPALFGTLSALAQVGLSTAGPKGSVLSEDNAWAWCKQAICAPAVETKPKAVRARGPRRAGAGPTD
jgi:AcrR family transcriptional regulator